MVHDVIVEKSKELRSIKEMQEALNEIENSRRHYKRRMEVLEEASGNEEREVSERHKDCERHYRRSQYISEDADYTDEINIGFCTSSNRTTGGFVIRWRES